MQEYPGDAQALARTELRIYERLLGTLRAEGAPPAFALTLSDKNTGGGEPALAPLLGCFDSVSVAAADQCVRPLGLREERETNKLTHGRWKGPCVQNPPPMRPGDIEGDMNDAEVWASSLEQASLSVASTRMPDPNRPIRTKRITVRRGQGAVLATAPVHLPVTL